MNFSPPRVGPMWMAVFSVLAALFCAASPLSAQQGGAPEQAAAQALELFNTGRHKEAVSAYEAIIKNYPTSAVVSEALLDFGCST